MLIPPLISTTIKTPLGTLHALANTSSLIYLGFEAPTDAVQTNQQLHALLAAHSVVPEKNDILVLLETELTRYFNHELTEFTVPLAQFGSPFQKLAWQALTKIPYGQTQSYKEQAAAIGNPKAYRAVGSANGANMIIIVVPCHRVIAHNKKLGGYTAGIEHKAWLLKHEKL